MLSKPVSNVNKWKEGRKETRSSNLFYSNTMSFGSGRGRGRGSRPGPPSWPHGTAPKDRGKFASNKFVETCEPPEVDWDEIRHQVSEVVINLEVT